MIVIGVMMVLKDRIVQPAIMDIFRMIMECADLVQCLQQTAAHVMLLLVFRAWRDTQDQIARHV